MILYSISNRVLLPILVSLLLPTILLGQGKEEKAFQELLKSVPVFAAEMLKNLESYSTEIFNKNKQALSTVLSEEQQALLGLKKTDFPDYSLTWIRAKQIRPQYVILLIGTVADQAAPSSEGYKYYLATYTPSGKLISQVLFASFQASSLGQDESIFVWEGDNLIVQIVGEYLQPPDFNITQIINEQNFYTLSPEGEIVTNNSHISVKYYKGDRQITDEDEINGVELSLGDLLYKYEGEGITEYIIYRIAEDDYFYQSTDPNHTMGIMNKGDGNIVFFSLIAREIGFKFVIGETILLPRPELGQGVTWEVPAHFTRLNDDGSQDPFRLKR